LHRRARRTLQPHVPLQVGTEAEHARALELGDAPEVARAAWEREHKRRAKAHKIVRQDEEG